MSAAGPTITLPYNWRPRDYQVPLWTALENGIKRAVLFWHRRAGKDLCMVNWIACSAMQRVGAYWHVFPTYKQGRKVAWEGLTRDGRGFIDHFPKEIISRYRDQEMTIEFVNGSTYSIVGADNPDSQAGTNPVGIVFSEFALLESNEIWVLLQPILAENGGWAIFITTPRGRNHAYRLYQDFKDDPEWFCEVLSYKDTGAITDQAVADAIAAGMSEEFAAQEFECSFDAALEHAWYGQQMKAAMVEGRIGTWPHLKDFPVETWWDIGRNDNTAIWFVQKHMGAIRAVHYEEARGKDHPYWVARLQALREEQNFHYSEHLLPHDATVTEWGSGKTRVERFYDANITNIRVVPKLGIGDGIGAVRAIIPNVYFHEPGCAKGIECLRQYSRKPLDGVLDQDGRQVYSETPKHDGFSDGADAFRTGAVGSRPNEYTSEGESEQLFVKGAYV